MYASTVRLHNLILHSGIATGGSRGTGGSILIRRGAEVVRHIGIELCFRLLGWARVSSTAAALALSLAGVPLSGTVVLLVSSRLGLSLGL